MSNTTPTLSMICFAVAAFLGAFGQYLYKTGANVSDGTITGYVLNGRLIAGVVCYIIVMCLFVAGFRIGGRMTVLYPIYATTFVWAAIISWRVYGTPISLTNLAGMVLIFAGIWFIGKEG